MHPILKFAYLAVVLCLTAYSPDTGKVPLPECATEDSTGCCWEGPARSPGYQAWVCDYQLPTL